MGTSVETSVLDYIREADNDLAQKIMDNMFTFDDLEKIDDKGIQALLKEVQSESLVIALKGATPELREKIFRNMSTRAAETLREDLESRGPVRVSEVEAEQKEMLKIVRRLVDEGQIVLGGGGDDAVRLSRRDRAAAATNVPPPAGGSRQGRAYARFIPREELERRSRPGTRATSPARPAPHRPCSAPTPPRPTRRRSPAPSRSPSSCARRASRATRTATATAWSRSKASSRASPRRRPRRSARCCSRIGDAARRAAAGDGARARASRRRSWRARSCAANCSAQPELVAHGRAGGRRHAAAERAPHHACACTPTTCRWSPQGAAEVLAARGARLLADAGDRARRLLVESDIGADRRQRRDPLAPRRRVARLRRGAGTATTPAATEASPAHEDSAMTGAPPATRPPTTPKWQRYLGDLRASRPTRCRSRRRALLVRVTGLVLEAAGIRVPVGSVCEVRMDGQAPVLAEVVGFSADRAYLMPTGDVHGLASGARVVPRPSPVRADDARRAAPPVAAQRGPHACTCRSATACSAASSTRTASRSTARARSRSVHNEPLMRRPINAMDRDPVRTPLDTGVRAINAMLTVGRGQRIGLFAGTGVGKSVLLGMMARYTAADVIVVGLIGERGREVKEFIEDILGEEGLRRAVVVAAPADAPPLLRMQGANYATAIAEHFRDRGQHVLLLMDSLTRYAMAQREIALAIGEPPATKGYPPSCFAKLPQLVERSGNGVDGGGSITAFYTVLTEGDDQQDPIADAARGILDGHIVLSRELAEAGHYPAIDIEKSVSRVMTSVASPRAPRRGAALPPAAAPSTTRRAT